MLRGCVNLIEKNGLEIRGVREGGEKLVVSCSGLYLKLCACFIGRPPQSAGTGNQVPRHISSKDYLSGTFGHKSVWFAGKCAFLYPSNNKHHLIMAFNKVVLSETKEIT